MKSLPKDIDANCLYMHIVTVQVYHVSISSLSCVSRVNKYEKLLLNYNYLSTSFPGSLSYSAERDPGNEVDR